MNMIDAVASMVIVLVLAALAWAAAEYLFPSDKSAESLGYMPGSEAPEGGWFRAIAGTVAVAAVFVLVFAHLGAAAGLT